MRHLALFLTFGLLGSLLPGSLAADDLSAADVAFFETRIRPVLVEHCYECHAATAKTPQAGLLLDSREGIRRGGDSGAAVVPGDVNASLLLDALRHETFEMPPQGKLPERVIADFAQWIERGAADPRDAPTVERPTGIDLDAGRSFWSFQPITRPASPDVNNEAWPVSDIDRFVLAGLEQQGLNPNPAADLRTLARRLYFDLIGLPPTPAELEAFLADSRADSRADALERLVDRLLDSPQFGHRWGRHWLDVVRFAESTGGGRTRIMPEAWRYRDYVIASLNRDKPFDQFVVEQLAGDLLPHESLEQRATQLTATSFLALGPINYELQDKTLLTMEIVDEQLSTVGSAFLGMTIGCARCHDHKFDPIPTRDYYAMAGIFRSTQTVEHANVSNWIERPLPMEPELQAEFERHAEAVAKVERELKAARQTYDALEAKRFADGPDGTVMLDDADAQVTGQWTASSAVSNFIGKHYLHATGSADGANSVVFAPRLPTTGEYEVRLSYTAHGNRASNASVRIDHAAGQTELKVDQRKSPPIGGLFVWLGRFRFDSVDGARVTISDRGANGHVIADAVQFVPVELVAAAAAGQPSRIDALKAFLGDQAWEARSEVVRLEAELKAMQRNSPPPAEKVMSVREAEQIADCPLHIRGSVKNLGEPVPRGYLSVTLQSPAPNIGDDRSGRLELARWIASPQNPLTARVYVNRVWSHLFGEGLVRTPDNFGTIGEPPTHPELLDHLATQFIDDGWSTKSLIRRIVLSRTYRMSSEPRDDGLEVDPANRRLWRMNRKRLEAEAIRDAILAISGQLDLSIGGSLIAPSLRSEFGYEFDGTRRSVYVPVFRNTMHELFEVFDIANPNLVNGRRSVSTLPTQGLYLMNSPFVMDQSRLAAERLLEGASDDEARIDLAFQRSLGRPPLAAERDFAREYLRLSNTPAAGDGVAAEAAPLERWARFQQTLFACLDFRYVK